MPDIVTFRESEPMGRIEVRINGKLAFSHEEYRGAMIWMEQNHPDYWEQNHPAIHRDYKDNYDSRRDD